MSRQGPVPGRIVQVGVTFREEQLTLEIPEDRLIGQWQGPVGVAPEDVERLVVEAAGASSAVSAAAPGRRAGRSGRRCS